MFQGEVATNLPAGDWQSPFYAVWINNEVQTFLYTGVRTNNLRLRINFASDRRSQLSEFYGWIVPVLSSR